MVYYNGRLPDENNGTSALIVTTEWPDNSSDLLYIFPTTIGEDWMDVFIPLPQGEYILKFTAQIMHPFGHNIYDMIALDDIEIHRKSCDEVKCDPVKCESRNYAAKCKGNGVCVSRARKSVACQCEQSYYGNHCEQKGT